MQTEADGQKVGEIHAIFQPVPGGLQPGATNFEDGFVAMVALSGSGATHCRFENIWLYLLGE
jgi:hypothetical protein